MQILFIHPNFPAQFGPMIQKLTQIPGVKCVFINRQLEGIHQGVYCIPFPIQGGATRQTHYCSRTFENAVWQSVTVYQVLSNLSELKPDLIIGHSGFGGTSILRELYDCPILNYFEYFYHPHDSDMDFREDFPPEEMDYLRSYMRNAMILMDLNYCNAGYTPTQWQKQLFPQEYQSKLKVIHDGIDTAFWSRRQVPRQIGNVPIPEEVKVVTFVSRGLEAMRGFDIFIKIANAMLAKNPNLLFICVGADKVYYGNDLKHINGKSFYKHVIEQEKPDLNHFMFTGSVSTDELVDIISMSDLHIYLSVPFVVSWSLLNAMACECKILASNTAPIREFIEDGTHGVLNNFFDIDGFCEKGLDMLAHPKQYQHLGEQARQSIVERYCLDVVFPQHFEMYQSLLSD